MPSKPDYHPHSIKDDIAYRQEAKEERRKEDEDAEINKEVEKDDDDDTKDTNKNDKTAKTQKDDSASNGVDAKSNTKTKSTEQKSRKRKNAAREPPAKTAASSKRARRTTERTADVDSKSVIKFLLSDKAAELSTSANDDNDNDSKDKNEKASRSYYSSDLTPFETLLCTLVLARPINHRLQSRAIHSLLNPPYSFTTPASVASSTDDHIWHALADARTQHKVKTAEALGRLGKVVVEKFCNNGDEKDGTLEKLRKDADYDVETERKLLIDAIKGFGETGADILFRRLQGGWKECFPCADKRAMAAMEKFGLKYDSVEDLAEVFKEYWGTTLSKSDKKQDGDVKNHDKKEKKDVDGDVEMRKAFVLLLERAVGIEIEGNMDEALDKMRAL